MNHIKTMIQEWDLIASDLSVPVSLLERLQPHVFGIIQLAKELEAENAELMNGISQIQECRVLEDEWRQRLETENARLHGKIMDANTMASVALQEKARLEAENERLREALENRRYVLNAINTMTKEIDPGPDKPQSNICPECGGEGVVDWSIVAPPKWRQRMSNVVCPTCNGKGTADYRRKGND